MGDVLTERLFKKAIAAVNARNFSAKSFGYEPDEKASDTGVWDRTTGTPEWKQRHFKLVQSAVNSFKGASSDMQIMVLDELRDEPTPSSGSGKIMRKQAAALIWEMRNKSRRTPKLYRGSHVEPSGLTCWTESRRIAAEWAKRNSGRVWVREAGGVGIRASDYMLRSDPEKEWIVDA